MIKNQEIEPFQENFFLHFNHTVVEDRVRQAIYKPGGLTTQQERELFGQANFVELLAYFGALPMALNALGQFIKFSDSLIDNPQEGI